MYKTPFGIGDQTVRWTLLSPMALRDMLRPGAIWPGWRLGVLVSFLTAPMGRIVEVSGPASKAILFYL
jgi:hypothetical protein